MRQTWETPGLLLIDARVEYGVGPNIDFQTQSRAFS
jgi:hypothetical protein